MPNGGAKGEKNVIQTGSSFIFSLRIRSTELLGGHYISIIARTASCNSYFLALLQPKSTLHYTLNLMLFVN